MADLRFNQLMDELEELAEDGRRNYNYERIAEAVLFGVRMRMLYALGQPKCLVSDHNLPLRSWRLYLARSVLGTLCMSISRSGP